MNVPLRKVVQSAWVRSDRAWCINTSKIMPSRSGKVLTLKSDGIQTRQMRRCHVHPTIGIPQWLHYITPVKMGDDRFFSFWKINHGTWPWHWKITQNFPGNHQPIARLQGDIGRSWLNQPAVPGKDFPRPAVGIPKVTSQAQRLEGEVAIEA